MNRKIPRVVLCFLIGLIVVATFQLAATPNCEVYEYDSRISPLHHISEVRGDLGQLEILQENLNFDLRSLKNQEHPQITATYQVQNLGQPVEMKIIFIAQSREKVSVSLNGATIPLAAILEANLPRDKQESSELPYIVYPGVSSLELYGEQKREKDLSFTATFPRGVSELQVSYSMQPDIDCWNFYRSYDIAYLLTSAKTWKAFATLEVKVELPPDWGFTTSLPMEQTNNTLTAKFEGIPADYLMITATPPAPEPEHLRTFERIHNLVTLIYDVVPLLCCLACCSFAYRTAVLFRRLNWGFNPGAIAVIFLMLLDTFIFIFGALKVHHLMISPIESWMLKQQQGITYYALYLEDYHYSEPYSDLHFILWAITLLATPILFSKFRNSD